MSCSRKQNAKYLGSNVKRKRTPPPFFQKEFTQTINTETEGEKKYKCGRQALTLSPFFHHPRVRPQETCLSVWGERGMLAHSSELYQLSAVEYENPLQDTHQSSRLSAFDVDGHSQEACAQFSNHQLLDLQQNTSSTGDSMLLFVAR